MQFKKNRTMYITLFGFPLNFNLTYIRLHGTSLEYGFPNVKTMGYKTLFLLKIIFSLQFKKIFPELPTEETDTTFPIDT